MQAKISAFCKPSDPKTLHQPPQLSDQIDDGGDLFGNKKNLEVSVTYKRRDPKPNPESDDDVIQSDNTDNEMGRVNGRSANPSLGSNYVGKILKKRSYGQFHLELGQSNFLLHTCSICGLMYARGDEGDEKVHKAFHKDYYQGIQFKGWHNERVVSTCSSNRDRIILVLDGDPPAQHYKVVKVMEREFFLSDGRLLHKLCKVYLFISSHRIVGCLITEPIKLAHRVISSSNPCKDSDVICKLRTNLGSPKPEETDTHAKRHVPTSLLFGNINFQREVARKENSMSRLNVNQWDGGAILCEEEAAPALCGIRAIWVVPCCRRKRVASKLLDAAR